MWQLLNLWEGCRMRRTVIIPSYKPHEYIYQCLDTIINQSLCHDEYEAVIVLNGCKEPYYGQLQLYIKEHSTANIRLLQTDEPGVSNARNIGIEAARGEYLTFIDDDDLVSPTYLADLLEVSSPTCVGCANSYAFVDDITERKTNFMTKAYTKCKSRPFSLLTYRQFLSPPWMKLIHKSIIGEIRFPTALKKSEDSVFCLQLTLHVKDVRLANESAIYYQRLREGSAMRTKNSFYSELKQLVQLECEYIKVWLKAPFSYNLPFLLSRMVAGCRNFISYVK